MASAAQETHEEQRDSGAQKKTDVPFRERAARFRHEHPRAVIGILAALVVLATAAIAFFLYERTFVSTDDAEVDGNISSIGARVSGVVTRVYVEDNQHVSAGDPIADLD